MIYTLTCNPAIDYVVRIPALTIGRIQRATEERIFFGGKGINVSRVLAELGQPSTALGFVAGFTGEALEAGIACELIHTDFVHLSAGMTRINIKLRAAEETDINGIGPAVTDVELSALYDKLDALASKDVLILSGSLPETLPATLYADIMHRLAGRGIRFVVDAAGEALLASLPLRPFLIKPNAEELGELFGVKIDSHDTALCYAHRLQEMGARHVLVTLGSLGAILVDEVGQEHRASACDITPVNTVGAGDSAIAGFLTGYLASGGDTTHALRLAVAAGSATAAVDALATGAQIRSYIS